MDLGLIVLAYEALEFLSRPLFQPISNIARWEAPINCKQPWDILGICISSCRLLIDVVSSSICVCFTMTPCICEGIRNELLDVIYDSWLECKQQFFLLQWKCQILCRQDSICGRFSLHYFILKKSATVNYYLLGEMYGDNVLSEKKL